MCQHLTTLAVSSDDRQVLRCEHGTIHIAWKCAMLHLRPNDFHRVVKLLEEGVTDLTFKEIGDGYRCCLVQQENGFYQLWFGDVMLFMDTADFLKFVDLLRVARREMDKLPPETLEVGTGFSASATGGHQIVKRFISRN